VLEDGLVELVAFEREAVLKEDLDLVFEVFGIDERGDELEVLVLGELVDVLLLVFYVVADVAILIFLFLYHLNLFVIEFILLNDVMVVLGFVFVGKLDIGFIGVFFDSR
jgi:hypothetical protein